MKTTPDEFLSVSQDLIVPQTAAPSRADKLLADLLTGKLTRSSLSRMIRTGQILVDAEKIRPSTIIRPGQAILIKIPDKDENTAITFDAGPEPTIIFEDDDMIVLDKPPGLIVHPGAGKEAPTLMEILVKSRPEMIGVGESGRWGIVHRLDKDTSGVMVVAKTQAAYEGLSEQFRRHSTGRIYMALVRGAPNSETGIVDRELGRSRSDRKKISTVTRKGRTAITCWSVKERYEGVCLMEIRPQTGRTHQIRVHLASIGLPVLGDGVYGVGSRKQKNTDPLLNQIRMILKRQALHAAFLAFKHPITENELQFSSGLPADMAEVIRMLKQTADRGARANAWQSQNS
ncbi:MAG: RluA family pseudouridine synthase [Desulfomonilaceae bacterium]